MFLELISNLPEKFRNITCEIQELPSKKSETFLKNSESKKEANYRELGLIVWSLVWKANVLTTIQNYVDLL